MFAPPAVSAFEAQLQAALAAHPEREPPVPGKVELALTGSEAKRFLVDTRSGVMEPRGQIGSPLTIRVPRVEFEGLVGRSLGAWLAAYDKGVVQLTGDPVKVEALEVYIDRVLRPIV